MNESVPLPRRPIVAIDGPAGAGKSTVAAHLAAVFGYLNLETGAMYRAFAFKALGHGVALDEEGPLMVLAAATRIALEPQPGGNRVLLDGEDVTGALRTPAVTAAASRVSVHPEVRRWLVGQQRKMGAQGGVVMEGRDIGTVVFPEAEVKIFLDADPEIRGLRRFEQTGDVPAQATQAAVVQELRERDQRDRNRTDSPLRPAPNAVVLDTTGMGLDEVLRVTERMVREAVQRTAAR